MFSGILDSIPVVGHVKGFVHLIAGDVEAANRSMYEASRSTAVIAGGALGAIGGPAGIAAGAAAAGAATDCLTSLVTQKPTGFVSGVADIATDVSNGKVPIKSVLKTGFIVGSDIVGGMAGPTIGNCATKAITQSTGKGIVIEMSKSGIRTVTRTTLIHGTTRSIIVEDEKSPGYPYSGFRESSYKPYSRNRGSSYSQQSSSQQSTNTSKNSNSTNSSNSSSSKSQSSGTNQQSKNSNASTSSGASAPGGQRPNNNNNNNKNNKKEHYEKSSESHWETFLKIFNAETLEEIIINGKKLFEKINSWQKKELRDFITKINNNYKHFDLTQIVKITLQLLTHVDQDLLTSHNFVNIAKFVLAYLCQELIEYNEGFRDNTKSFNTSRAEFAEIITLEDDLSFSHIEEIFRNLLDEIGELSSTIDPQFVNVIAAVYHYFKHKFIESQNILFAPAEYFDLARQGLERLRTFPQFERLMEAGARRIVYQRYYSAVGRRLTIVIKQQGSKWNLSSCYFEDDIHENDEDGEEWINDEKLPRK